MIRVYFKVGDTVIDPYVDYGVILGTYTISPPKPRTNFVTIEGRDGDLDYSDWAGGVRYNTRDVTISLLDMEDNCSSLITLINGRRIQFWFDNDPKWTYYGRVTGIDTNYSIRQRVNRVTITITCDPYKMSTVPTVMSYTLSNSETNVTLRPVRKPVIPVMTVTGGTCTLRVGTTSTVYQSGTHTLPLLTAANPIVAYVSGTGTVTFRWTDGDF